MRGKRQLGNGLKVIVVRALQSTQNIVIFRCCFTANNAQQLIVLLMNGVVWLYSLCGCRGGLLKR